MSPLLICVFFGGGEKRERKKKLDQEKKFGVDIQKKKIGGRYSEISYFSHTFYAPGVKIQMSYQGY